MKLNKYDIAFFVGLALWLIETALFGWNAKAGSVAEEMCDGISLTIAAYGALGSLIKSMTPTVTLNVHLRAGHLSAIDSVDVEHN